MIGTRHEQYKSFTNGLPFVFNADLKRTYFNRSKENNWHDNLEIQLCTFGTGTVILDGEKHPFNKNDIVVVNSNVLHYTGTDKSLNYSCLIISTDFCKKVGLDPNTVLFSPFIKSERIIKLFCDLSEVYSNSATLCRIAKLNKLVLEILIELAEHHTVPTPTPLLQTRKYETVKAAVSYIRSNYQQKITLEEIAKAVLCDKYALCREFKKLTGQTIVENLNNYRCIKAIECLTAGQTVARTAALCGFDNLSFFTKTFKKYIGKLPSEYKK
jgi:AraC-like DNA-binding protein